jgi:glutamate-ammonia-ligase adenylyltransferase
MKTLCAPAAGRNIPDALREEADRAWERFVVACADARLSPPSHPEFVRVLRGVWACSSFVSQACIGHPDLIIDLTASGDLFRDMSPDEYGRRLRKALSVARDGDELGRLLRRHRRREMVRIAWRDLAGWTDIDQTLRETSWLAEAAIDAALDRIEAEQAPGDRHRGRGRLVVFGMGKLGGHELNFSSDVDLICAYDELGWPRSMRSSPEEFFADLVRRLVAAIGGITEEGFVFRVDLRLRPYGSSGPLAMSFGQIEEYYQSQGREWERYAMIKARPVAGNREAGQRLLEVLRPFVYRRYLDFGVFEALREMKALIDREAATKEKGDDIKLGPGGIREIEFIAQTYQLVRGGREPALRERSVILVLSRLAEAGHLPRAACAELTSAYRFLRRVENRLQMFADQQTHRLPAGDHLVPPARTASSPADRDRLRLAWSMGFQSWPELDAELDRHRHLVRHHFERVFAARAGRVTPAAARVDEVDFSALWREARDETGPATSGRGSGPFGDEGSRRLRALRESYLYRSLSETGRARMDRLMPLVLQSVAAAERPDVTLIRVLDLIEQIARRTAYLALLAEHPTVLTHMVQLCAASPWIARMLGKQPLLLDELIDPRTLFAPQDRAALERNLSERLDAVGPDDLEQQMEVLRQFKQAAVLRVAAADVAGAMPLMVVSDHLTDIAEVTLRAVLHLAQARMTRHDRRAEKAIARGFAIVGYGKLGGIELGYGSDLDLVFLHGGGADDAALPFYPRLAQRIVHLLSAHTPAGVLYEIDLQLRPSGSSGLLVSSIDAFEDYQRSEAWTWEHQALVRARVVAGDGAIARRFGAVRAEVLSRPRDEAALRRDIRDMRERMRKRLSHGGAGRFDLKQDRGGITDIEFLVQFAVLRWAHQYPVLVRWTDNVRLLETMAQAGVVAAEDAAMLSDAYRAYRARVHQLALQEVENPVVGEGEFARERAVVADLWHRMIGEPE